MLKLDVDRSVDTNVAKVGRAFSSFISPQPHSHRPQTSLPRRLYPSSTQHLSRHLSGCY